jgi:hypothetical protein
MRAVRGVVAASGPGKPGPAGPRLRSADPGRLGPEVMHPAPRPAAGAHGAQRADAWLAAVDLYDGDPSPGSGGEITGRLGPFAEAFTLRPDRVLRVADGDPAGLEDAEPGDGRTSQQCCPGQRRNCPVPAA